MIWIILIVCFYFIIILFPLKIRAKRDLSWHETRVWDKSEKLLTELNDLKKLNQSEIKTESDFKFFWNKEGSDYKIYRVLPVAKFDPEHQEKIWEFIHPKTKTVTIYRNWAMFNNVVDCLEDWKHSIENSPRFSQEMIAEELKKGVSLPSDET